MTKTCQLTLKPPHRREDEQHEQARPQNHTDPTHEVIPVPVDRARPAPFLAHELPLLAHALAEAADRLCAEVLQGHSACCRGEHVDSAEDERTGPSAAEVGDGVEQLAGRLVGDEVEAPKMKSRHWAVRSPGSGLRGLTHSHIRPTNEGIGNLSVESGDPDELDGTAKTIP